MTPEGAAIVTLQQFEQRHPVKLEKAAPIACHHQLLWRAHQSAGRMPQYDLVNLNCEHYATWLMGEKPESVQVKGVFVLALIGALAWLVQ
jgi:hypothetical protein